MLPASSARRAAAGGPTVIEEALTPRNLDRPVTNAVEAAALKLLGLTPPSVKVDVTGRSVTVTTMSASLRGGPEAVVCAVTICALIRAACAVGLNLVGSTE